MQAYMWSAGVPAGGLTASSPSSRMVRSDASCKFAYAGSARCKRIEQGCRVGCLRCGFPDRLRFQNSRAPNGTQHLIAGHLSVGRSISQSSGAGGDAREPPARTPALLLQRVLAAVRDAAPGIHVVEPTVRSRTRRAVAGLLDPPCRAQHRAAHRLDLARRSAGVCEQLRAGRPPWLDRQPLRVPPTALCSSLPW